MRKEEYFVKISDTKLFVSDRGQKDNYPVIVLHGGPGLDHHEFGTYLDPLCDTFRLLLVDMRSQGKSDRTPKETWTIHTMANDINELATSMQLENYAVLGHSYGALVALQQAVTYPGNASQSIISHGFPSVKYLDIVEKEIAMYEPKDVREKIKASWEKEQTATTAEEFQQLMLDQMPFHFNKLEYLEQYFEETRDTIYSVDVLRHFSQADYGMIDVEDNLSSVTQPTLVLTGRHDRVCSVDAAKAIHNGIRSSTLYIFDESAHMSFVEETETYLNQIRSFLSKSTS